MLKFVKIFNFGRCEGFEPSPLVSQTNTLPIELTSPYTLCTLNFYSSYNFRVPLDGILYVFIISE